MQRTLPRVNRLCDNRPSVLCTTRRRSVFEGRFQGPNREPPSGRNPRDGTQGLVLSLSRKNEMAAFKDPTGDGPEATVISKNWVKGFEMIDQWIGTHVDTVTKFPLAFVIRVEEPDRSASPSSKYLSLADEIAKRCEITDVNNVACEWTNRCANKVWNLLYTIFQNHEAYSYMKPYRKACDGRGAYFALK